MTNDPDQQRALALQDAYHASRQAAAATMAASHGESHPDRIAALSQAHAALCDVQRTLEGLRR